MKNTQWHRALTLLLSLCMLLSVVPMGALAAEDSDEYTLYPAPHEITYGDGSYELKNLNVIYGTGMDEATKARMTETAQLRGLTVTESAEADTAKTNVYVAVYGSGDAVESYITGHYTVDAALFSKTDAHFVASSNGEIVVLGRDVDACFYGITTLYQIFGQLASNVLRNFTIRDYADVASRGFIEGYYGNPWSLEDRINLMKWGGYYKLNSYFYAPKDDPKHNSAWRELYTPEELETLIKPLAEAGNESKCRFVFALHPYMYNPISYASDAAYQADLKVLQDKFLQVIQAGVRQIAILADDAGNVGSANYIKTLEDMTKWLEGLQDTYPDLKLLLPFVTQEYMYNGQSYYRNFPENVQIVMTGGKVWGEVSNSFTSTFYNNAGRGPYMWINWPCTDNSKKHLIMGGYTTFLHPGVDPSKIQGIVLNPMQQSEPSKVAIFGNACYSWNIWETEEEANAAYDTSFACVDHNTVVPTAASNALKELSKHMINQNMDGRVTPLQESVALKDELTAFRNKLTAGTYTQEDIDSLIEEFTILQDAAKTYRASGNTAVAGQIVYWLDCWDDTTKAVISYLNALSAIRNHQGDAAIWQAYSAGQEAYTSSLDHPLWYMDHYEYAEVGVQHIVPLMKALDAYVSEVALGIVYPNGRPAGGEVGGALRLTPFEGNAPGHYSGSLANVVDGSADTSVWYNGVAQSGQYIGVNLNEVAKLGQITFTQDEGDRFYSYELQYSTDGSNYTTYNTYTDAQLTVDLIAAGIEAQYVRFVSSDSNGKWVKIYEISVNRASTTTVMTNRNELASLVTKIVADRGELVTTGTVTLAPNEYIGLDLGRIKDLSAISVEDLGDLTLEISMNQVQWTQVTPGQMEEDARYVRLINKTDSDVTTELTEFVVTSNEIQAPSLHSSNIGINSSWGVSEDCRDNGAAFDGNVNTMTEFADFPQKGQYIIYDLGQERNIRKLEIYCADSAVNYIRDAKLQISNDLTNWMDVLTIGDGVENTDDAGITCINSDAGYSQSTSTYPNYVSIEGTCEPTPARYLRILITASNNNRAVVFTEIEINEGEYVSVSNDPGFQSNVIEAQGYPPQNMVDGDLTTSYKPGTDEAGYMIYTFSDNLQANRINIAQKTISNAKVSLYREKDGAYVWEEVGTLDQSMATFACGGSLKVKLEWTAGNPVNITEIVRYTVEEPSTTQVALKTGETQTITVSGDFTSAALTGLDTKIATVTLNPHDTSDTKTLSAPLSALSGEKQYLIVHNRANKLLHNTADGNTLTLNGSTASFPDSAVWSIRAAENGYTIQDASGKYLTVGASTAAVVEEPVVLSVSYNTSISAWEIGLDGQYLNQYNGTVSNQAAGWTDGAATDEGSRWRIYEVLSGTAVESTDIVFTGVSEGQTAVTIGKVTYEITVTADHTHAFDQKNTDGKYLVSEATCEHPATYHYSCTCGEAGEETFEHGTLGAHVDEDPVDEICDVCGEDLAPEQSDVIRLKGKNRHETSLKTADEMKEVLGVEKFDTIIVADGYEFYDALSGSYLAAVKKAPILLSYSGDDKYAYLNDNNLDYIKANLAENGIVYILGGENAVPTTYDTELKNSEINVKRLGGAHRFDTNLQILEEAGIPAGSEILVCTSSSFADSLSAAATGKPILLVWNERGDLYGNQATFLSSLENCTFTIIGGENAVSKKFEKVLKNNGYTVDRLAGSNRFETSVEVAERYFQNVDQAVLAYAWEFPDGLCGGSLAYAMKAPLILTMSGYEDEAANYANDNGITSGVVLGGAARVSDASVREIFNLDEDAVISAK